MKQYTVPTVPPPKTLATNPTGVTPPFVPRNHFIADKTKAFCLNKLLHTDHNQGLKLTFTNPPNANENELRQVTL